MTDHEIRASIHAILDAHDAALTSIRTAHTAMQTAFSAHDDALVSAIEANRAALTLLNRMMNDGGAEDTDDGVVGGFAEL